MLDVAGVGGFTDEGMSILMPRSGPTLQAITLNGATSLGKESGRETNEPLCAIAARWPEGWDLK